MIIRNACRRIALPGQTSSLSLFSSAMFTTLVEEHRSWMLKYRHFSSMRLPDSLPIMVHRHQSWGFVFILKHRHCLARQRIL